MIELDLHIPVSRHSSTTVIQQRVGTVTFVFTTVGRGKVEISIRRVDGTLRHMWELHSALSNPFGWVHNKLGAHPNLLPDLVRLASLRAGELDLVDLADQR